jgi:hypothetical protein
MVFGAGPSSAGCARNPDQLGGFQEIPAEDENRWGVLRDVGPTGRLQVYIPEESEAPSQGQLIAAQLSANKSADFMDDGSLLIWGSP